MRIWLLLLAFLGASGAAVAGDDIQDARVYDSGDYAGLAYYRMDFGGDDKASLRHTVGFRMDNERALHSGRPALVKAEYSAGTSTVMMNGVNLSAIQVAAQATGGGMFSGWTVADFVWASIAGVVLLVGTASAVDEEDEDAAPAGSGTGGN